MDREVSNADWKLKFPEAYVVVLPRTHSDHNPILIDSADYISNCRQNFRYQAAWLNHDHAISESIRSSGHSITSAT